MIIGKPLSFNIELWSKKDWEKFYVALKFKQSRVLFECSHQLIIAVPTTYLPESEISEDYKLMSGHRSRR